jgi:urease accessory protein
VLAPGTDVSVLADAIYDRLADSVHDVTAGTSVLKDNAGVTVRVLGDRSADVTAAIDVAWDESRLVLLDVGAPVGGDKR